MDNKEKNCCFMLHYTGMLKFIQPNVSNNVFEVIQKKKKEGQLPISPINSYTRSHISAKKNKFHQKK